MRVGGDVQRRLAERVRLVEQHPALRLGGGSQSCFEESQPELLAAVRRSGRVGDGSLVREPEVMCEQIGELALALAGGGLDPGGDIRVRPSTVPPGERAVRHVARENVLEEELALAGDSRPELREHELAVLEPPERLVRALRSRPRGAARPNRSRTPDPRRTRTEVRSARPRAAGRCARRAPPARCRG